MKYFNCRKCCFTHPETFSHTHTKRYCYQSASSWATYSATLPI